MAVIDATALITAAHQNFWLEGGDLVATGLDGLQVVVGVENRRWVGVVDLPPQPQASAMRLRALSDQMRGRLNPLRLTVANMGTPHLRDGVTAFYLSLGYTSAEVLAGKTLHSDGTGFSDGTGYAIPSATEPVVTVAAGIGATVLELSGLMAEHLAIGAFFSIRDHLYRVADNADGRITFNPPLRRAVVAGDAVAVSRPTVQLRPAKADGLRIWQDYCRHSRPASLDVVEVVDHD